MLSPPHSIPQPHVGAGQPEVTIDHLGLVIALLVVIETCLVSIDRLGGVASVAQEVTHRAQGRPNLTPAKRHILLALGDR